MVNMKLWEVLKALEENPKKRFTSKFGSMSAEIFADDLSVNFMHTESLELSLDASRDWQEVKQPVTWQEAIEAWANGKLIKYENEHGCLTYSGNTLKDEIGPLASYQLTTGTWYIED